MSKTANPRIESVRVWAADFPVHEDPDTFADCNFSEKTDVFNEELLDPFVPFIIQSDAYETSARSRGQTLPIVSHISLTIFAPN